MQVRNLLMRIHPDIGEQTISGLYQTQCARYLADSAHKSGYFRITGCGAKIVPADISAFGYDEDMRRCLRIDVVKGKRPVIFKNGIAGNLPAQDFGKDILVVIRQRRINWHFILRNCRARPFQPGRIRLPCGQVRREHRQMPRHLRRARSLGGKANRLLQR